MPFLSVGYRLAPEVTGTTLAQDVFSGLVWLIDHATDLRVDPARVAVMGDSGGGAPTAGPRSSPATTDFGSPNRS